MPSTRDDLVRSFIGQASQPRTQTKGARAGQTYRIKRGIKSGAAVRVYNALDDKPGQTALVPGSRPATPPKPTDTAIYQGPLTQRHSARHGGAMWSYRRGASGRLIPVRKA